MECRYIYELDMWKVVISIYVISANLFKYLDILNVPHKICFEKICSVCKAMIGGILVKLSLTPVGCRCRMYILPFIAIYFKYV